MKKFILLLGLFLALSSNARTEVYHGIDIDYIYEHNDWSSRDKIKEIIDDYTLLLQYQKEFDACPNELPEIIGCYDKIAEKIITSLYVFPEHNTDDYKQLKKALSEAYGLKNCRHKYGWPAGHMCELDRMSDMTDALKKYIQSLIDKSKEGMFSYSSILEEYE